MRSLKYTGIVLGTALLFVIFAFLGGRSAGIARTLASMRKKLVDEKIGKKNEELSGLKGARATVIEARRGVRDEISNLKRKRERLRRAAEEAESAEEVMDLFRSIK